MALASDGFIRWNRMPYECLTHLSTTGPQGDHTSPKPLNKAFLFFDFILSFDFLNQNLSLFT